VTFTAACGGVTACQYRFFLNGGAGWSIVRDWASAPAWVMGGAHPAGHYLVRVEAWAGLSPSAPDATSSDLGFDLVVRPATGAFITASAPGPHKAGSPVVFTATGTGSDSPYDYQFWLNDGATWTMVQAYGNGSSWVMPGETPPGTYSVAVEVRTSSSVPRDANGRNYDGYVVVPAITPATGATITASAPSPQTFGTAVAFASACTGTTDPCDYQFWLWNGTTWTMVQAYGGGASWTMPGTTPPGTYAVAVEVRTTSGVARDAYGTNLSGYIIRSAIQPATGATITAGLPSPQNAGTAVTFTAAGTGSVDPYDYQFWLWNGAVWTMVQGYGNGASWTMPSTQPIGSYSVAVEVRTSSTVARDAYGRNLDGYVIR